MWLLCSPRVQNTENEFIWVCLELFKQMLSWIILKETNLQIANFGMSGKRGVCYARLGLESDCQGPNNLLFLVVHEMLSLFYLM